MCDYIKILREEVVPALGCTEPTSVAYAVSFVSSLLKGKITKIELFLSGNIIKNGMGVGVPNTGDKGLFIAAAAGAIIRDPSLGLELLKELDEKKRNKAQQLIKEDRILIKRKEIINKLYIEVICHTEKEEASIIIADSHTNIVFQRCGKDIQIDKRANYLIFEEDSENKKSTNSSKENILTVKNIFEFVENCKIEDLSFLKEGIELNTKIAEEGLNGQYGLELGKSIASDIENKTIGDDFINHAISYTVAATDARMDGSFLSVMSNSGSGNQGLTVFLPVIAVYTKLKMHDESKLIKALALSNLIAIHLKYHLGRLSALCGAVLAAIGSGCAISYLFGGDYQEMEKVIKNMAGTLTGMICDGAKPGCSFKVSSAINSACISVLAARQNRVLSANDGIIDDSVEKTIKNLCEIGSRGMTETDKMILNIMVSK